MQAPPNEAAPLYLQFAALEEEHGLARAAMEVRNRSATARVSSVHGHERDKMTVGLAQLRTAYVINLAISR